MAFEILQQKWNRVIERLEMWCVDRTDLCFVDDDQRYRRFEDEKRAHFRVLQKAR